MVRELHVWFFSQCAGILTQDKGYLSFRYLPEWLESKNARPLSHSLPLRIEPFDDPMTKPFFAGLLPEGNIRTDVANILKVSSKNDFAILDGIGGECAGALILLEPSQVPPIEAHESCSIEWLDEGRLHAVLERLPKRPLLAGESGLRLSLAGAQVKLPLIVREVLDQDGLSILDIGLPKNNIPSSSILKSEIAGLDGSVYNEAFCLALARELKLDAATAHIGRTKDKTYLLVERYERFHDDGHLRRLHQEDFCQALGIPPQFKYQNEGGPSIADGFELVRKVTRPSAPNVLRLLDYIIFNTLVGNNDAHGKNFSLLYGQSGIQLAPIYDVLSTAVYPDLNDKMAMKIGSKYRFDELHARHWGQMAEAAQLGAPQLKRRVLVIAGELPDLAKGLQAQFEAKGWGHPIISKIVTLIEERCVTTANRFSLAE